MRSPAHMIALLLRVTVAALLFSGERAALAESDTSGRLEPEDVFAHASCRPHDGCEACPDTINFLMCLKDADETKSDFKATPEQLGKLVDYYKKLDCSETKNTLIAGTGACELLDQIRMMLQMGMGSQFDSMAVFDPSKMTSTSLATGHEPTVSHMSPEEMMQISMTQHGFSLADGALAMSNTNQVLANANANPLGGGRGFAGGGGANVAAQICAAGNGGGNALNVPIGCFPPVCSCPSEEWTVACTAVGLGLDLEPGPGVPLGIIGMMAAILDTVAQNLQPALCGQARGHIPMQQALACANFGLNSEECHGWELLNSCLCQKECDDNCVCLRMALANRPNPYTDPNSSRSCRWFGIGCPDTPPDQTYLALAMNCRNPKPRPTGGSSYANQGMTSGDINGDNGVGTSATGTGSGTLTTIGTGTMISTETITGTGTGVTTISISGGPVMANGNTCTGNTSSPIVVNTLNSLNAASAVATNTVINLASTSANGAFFSDSACSVPITQVVILAGQSSSGSIFYKDTSYGSLSATLSAHETPSLGLTGGTQMAMINGISKIGFSSIPSMLDGNVCSGSANPIVFQTQNSMNSAVAPTVAVTYALTSSSANGTFYSDSSCSTPITQVVIAGNTSSSPSIYYRDTSFGSPSPYLTIAETPSTSWTDASQMVMVNGISKLMITSAPSNVAAATCTGVASPLIVKTTNMMSTAMNVVADMVVAISSSSSQGTFFSDTSCTIPITQVTIAAGTNTSPSIYYKDGTVGSPTLTLTVTPQTTPNITAATQMLMVH